MLWMCFIFNSVFGQVITFERDYDSLGCYYAYNVLQNFDGGFIFCGVSYDASLINQAAILRTDSTGNLIWLRAYGSPAIDAAILCTMTPDSNILIVGIRENYSSTDGKIWILKLDQSGNIIWTKSIKVLSGNNRPSSIDMCLDGGFIISGSCNTQAAPGEVSFLLRIDSLGNELWSKTYGNNIPNSGYYAIQTLDSGFALVTDVTVGIYSNFRLIKTDSIGDTLWTKSFGNPDFDVPVCIRQNYDGNYIFVGNTFNANNWDIYLSELDAYGNIIWNKQFGDSLSNTANCIQITTDGNYFIVGTEQISGSNDGQALLMKVDTGGTLLWKSDIGGPLTENGWWGIECSDGGFAIVGEVDIATPPHEGMYFLKVNQFGTLNSINHVELKSSFDLFPIPAHDYLTVKIDYEDKFALSIVNLEGKQSKKIEAIDREQIDISYLSTGFYFAIVRTKHQTFIKKFIKN